MSAVIGVDLGGTKTLVVQFAADGSCVGERRIATPRDPETAVAAIAAEVGELAIAHGRAAAVGVGFAGLVDAATGLVDSSVILPEFGGFALRAALAECCAAPVVLDNDATAAGIGEFVALGRPPGLHLLVLTVGTGIGGAAVLAGHVLRGATGAACEFGNMTIDWRGDGHACGNRGCLNTLASGTAIAARAARPSQSAGAPTLEQVAAAAAAGDAGAREAIESGARALGAGIANLVMAFNPHRVALMGGVLALGDEYLAAVRDEVRQRTFARARDGLQLEPCLLGPRTGAFGAAVLAREEVLR